MIKRFCDLCFEEEAITKCIECGDDVCDDCAEDGVCAECGNEVVYSTRDHEYKGHAEALAKALNLVVESGPTDDVNFGDVQVLQKDLLVCKRALASYRKFLESQP